MKGEKRVAQARRFHESDLKAMFPQNHRLRRIGAVLDPSSLCAELARHYSHIGRASIDPDLVIRMSLVEYCYGIRPCAASAKKPD